MDWSVIIGPVITGAITACVSGFSVYVVMSNRMAILETKMDNVQGQLEQQNRYFDAVNTLNVKVATLENNHNTYWKRYDDMDKRVSRLESE